MFTFIFALLSLLFGFKFDGPDIAAPVPAPVPVTVPVVPQREPSITTLSPAQIGLFKPYSLYAATAYCPPSKTLNWSCGVYCEANPTFQPIASGGDGSGVQFWYVGLDPTLRTIIVAQQGTNPFEILADLTDLKFFPTHPDPTLFPGLPSTIQVHNGFATEHKKTAPSILKAVQTLLAQHGPSTPVVITGHSLGAALALLNTVYLSLHLPAGTSLSMIGYGLPRVGNAAFADYVDATANVTHVNNRADPVTIVPPEFVGFRHPAGEIHIDRESGAWNVCPGQDNPSKLCVAGHVPTVLKGNVMDHVGPYDEGILMGWC